VSTTSTSDAYAISTRPADEFSGPAQSRLVEGLIAALPGLRMRALFAARRDMFNDADLITTAESRTGELAGVLASRWVTVGDDLRFLHITSQFVAEGHRHGVVFRRSWADHLATLCAGAGGFPTVSVLKTYNPQVYCAMNSLAAVPGVSFYPAVDHTSSLGLTGLAVRISRAVSPGHPFDPVAGVIRGAGVPADLYLEPPRSSNQAVNHYFARHARPADRVLCLLSIPAAVTGEVHRVFTKQRQARR